MAKNKNFSISNTMTFSSLRDQVNSEPVKEAKTAPDSITVDSTPRHEHLTDPVGEMPEPKLSKPVVVKKTDSDTVIKTTSVSIHRKSLNYLAYMAKLSSVNQNDYLASLLISVRESSGKIKPDFNAVRTKRDTVDMVVKGIKLPEDILLWTKSRAALEMKSISEFIDDLLLDKINNM